MKFQFLECFFEIAVCTLKPEFNGEAFSVQTLDRQHHSVPQLD
jgi:hypothetical protein